MPRAWRAKRTANMTRNVDSQVLLPWLMAGLLFVAMTFIYWPGALIGDNVRQLAEIRSNAISDWHSPWHTTVWKLLGAPRTQGLLVVELGLYWTGFALVADALRRCAGLRWALAMLAVGLTPASLLYLGRLQKDTFFVACLVLAAGLIARQMRLAALVPLLSAMLSRMNAVFAVGPMALRNDRHRLRDIGLALLLSLALIGASRLINFGLFDAQHSQVEKSLQLFDIAGIEHFSGDRSVEPQISACYTPFWWDQLEIGCHAFSNSKASLTKVWLDAIARHPIAYAQHRLAAFNRNIYFLAEPGQDCAADPKNAFCQGNSAGVLRDALLRNPFLWPVTWLVLGLAFVLTRPVAFAQTLTVSGLAYGLTYLPFGVAAGFRYFYWTEIAIQIALVWQAATVGIPRWRWLLAAVLAVWVVGLTWRYVPLIFA